MKKDGETKDLYPKVPLKEPEHTKIKVVCVVGKKPETKRIQSLK